MGRKKKTVNSDEIVTISESFGAKTAYKGNVTVIYSDTCNKYYTLKKQNKGFSGLFIAITKSLAGQSTVGYIPTKIQGYNVVQNESSSNEMFTQKIGYAQSPALYWCDFKNDGTVLSSSAASDAGKSNTVEYIFMIPKSNIVNKTDTIKKLALFNDMTSGEAIKCAEVTLDPKDYISTNVQGNILIYWRLSVLDF